MHQAAFLIALAWLSFCFAKVEIAIEGPHGWAEKLPTWRLPDGHWANAILGGKTVTGYHFWIITFMLFVLHFPLLFIQPTWRIEAQILSFFALFWVLEDFLWFALNPAFGVANFRPGKIWWHGHWWGPVPRDYYWGVGIGVALYGVSLL